MNKKVLLITSLMLASILAGCATTTSKPTMSANGKPAHAVNCSAVKMVDCYQKAGEICGDKGYKILNKYYQEGFILLTSREKWLVIECNLTTMD